MTEVGTGIEIKEEELIGIEEVMDLGTEVDAPPWIKGKKESVITEEN